MESSKILLKKCLEDEDLNYFFKKFSEWSSENYLLYFDIFNFQNSKSFEDQKKLAHDIFNNYLNGIGAPLEVNINQQLCFDISNKLENDDIYSEIFDVILQEILKNLLGSFSIFRHSRAYLNHFETKVFVESQIVS